MAVRFQGVSLATLVTAHVRRETGWVQLRFGYNRATIEILKEIPGCRWDPEVSSWQVPIHAWEILKHKLQHVIASETGYGNLPAPSVIYDRLWPHQKDAVSRLISNSGYMLTMQQRTGKTPSLIAAVATMFQAGQIDTAMVLAPQSVTHEWQKQLFQFANIRLFRFEGLSALSNSDIAMLRAYPYLIFSSGYESLPDRVEDAEKILHGRRFVIIADEIQNAQNAKARRFGAMKKLRMMPGCVAAWGATGTPMRNRTENLWAIFDWLLPGSMSSFIKYSKRYCGAVIKEHGTHKEFRDISTWKFKSSHGDNAISWHPLYCGIIADKLKFEHPDIKDVSFNDTQTELRISAESGKLKLNAIRDILKQHQVTAVQNGDLESVVVEMPGHWDTSGISNAEELHARLDAISFTVTRAQVAPWLPKSDRKVIACEMPPKMMERYKQLEQAVAVSIKAGLQNGGAQNQATKTALESLAQVTSKGKIPTAIQRIDHHTANGLKVLVFAHFHETLRNVQLELEDRFQKASAAKKPLPIMHFCAGGWLTPEKRHAVIEQWKSYQGPAILLANALSSGVGIDLSDAGVTIFLELEWTPADFRQAEDRSQDMHHGKRTESALYEYLLVRQTIDEQMAACLLEKIRAVDAVVGKEQESRDLGETLRASGTIGAGSMILPSTDHETVQAALKGIRDRWLKDDTASTQGVTPESIAAGFQDYWDTEIEEEVET